MHAHDFPQLNRSIGGKRIIYLDSTATALKPRQVILKEREYYEKYSANVFRGIYTISEEATIAFEKSREKIAHFIHCSDRREIVFTRNATESLNVLAYSLIGDVIQAGEVIISTVLEHHSNYVPWQQLAKQHNIDFIASQVTNDGEIDVKSLLNHISKQTKLVTFTAVSNVTGSISPIREITQKIKAINPSCIVVVDGAQAVPHMVVDVQSLGIDALVFSSHKMMGPTGIGVLWAKFKLLERMRPYQYGGEMISAVHELSTTFQEPPMKFEAGTPHIAGVIGLGAAVDYLEKIGMEKIREHEIEITRYALDALQTIPNLQIIGPKDPIKRGGVVAFTIDGLHPHDIAQVLNDDNICIRAGFHCAQVLHESLYIGPTARASFYLYTEKEDVDALIVALMHVRKVLL